MIGNKWKHFTHLALVLRKEKRYFETTRLVKMDIFAAKMSTDHKKRRKAK